MKDYIKVKEPTSIQEKFQKRQQSMPKKSSTRKELVKTFKQEMEDREREMNESFKPTKAMQKAAERGLESRRKAKPSEKGGLTNKEAGKLGIGSGVQRASDIASGDNLSENTIKKMHGFFNRHRKNKNTPKGKIAWDLWGGDAGAQWAASKVKKMRFQEYVEVAARNLDTEEYTWLLNDGDVRATARSVFMGAIADAAEISNYAVENLYESDLSFQKKANDMLEQFIRNFVHIASKLNYEMRFNSQHGQCGVFDLFARARKENQWRILLKLIMLASISRDNKKHLLEWGWLKKTFEETCDTGIDFVERSLQYDARGIDSLAMDAIEKSGINRM